MSIAYFPKNVAVISFYDPPSNHSNPPVDYSAKTERVFAIAIHDIDLSVLMPKIKNLLGIIGWRGIRF